MAKAAKKILLVDDEQMITRVLRRFLELDGYEVLEAGSAKEAIKLFLRERPLHLLICDVYLEGASGWALAEKIYLSQPTIRVLMISGANYFGVTPDTLDYEVLSKPFNREDLKQAIARLFSR